MDAFKFVSSLSIFFYIFLNGCAQQNEVIGLSINGKALSAKVARTPEERVVGLMFQQHLPENEGMLFIYPKPKKICMWTRHTPLPLSVAFLNKQGVIINIEKMMPENETLHCSKGKAVYALEMNQGWFEKNSVIPGVKLNGI